MSDLNNSYDEFDEQPSGGGNNRNFTVAIIAIVVVFVIIVVAVGGFFLYSRSGASSKAPLAGTQAAIIYTQNAQTAAAATSSVGTEVAKSLITPTDTETPIPPAAANPEVSTSEPTSVVKQLPSETPTPNTTGTPGSGIGGPVSTSEIDAAGRTATIAVLMTQVASGGATLENPLLTPTALPKTGFMDEVGLPLMTGMALLLIFIIFMARRLRVTANR